MEKKNGGKRAGAGRKSKAETLDLVGILDEAVSRDDWTEIFKACKDKAKRGSLPHATFLASYAFGKPVERIQHSGDADNPIVTKAYDYRTAIAPLAGGSGEDSDAPSEDKDNSDGAAVGQDSHGG